MPTTDAAEFQNLCSDLVHDLRQPLSVIEDSACYLKLLLRQSGEPAASQLQLILRQVDVASRMLSQFSQQVVRDPRRLAEGAQTAGNPEHRAFTKSQTAGVT